VKPIDVARRLQCSQGLVPEQSSDELLGMPDREALTAD
jgi:hypothetical protein